MSTVGMTNLNADTEPGGLLSEQDFEHLTRKPWLVPSHQQKPAPPERSRIGDVIFAVTLGVLAGVALAHWLAR